MQRALDIYVPLKGSLVPPRPNQHVPESQTFPLDPFMQSLLGGTLSDIHACFPATSRPSKDTRVFFIQGAAGAGKSLFCWRTMQCFDMATTLSTFPVPVRVPIVITLPNVKQRMLAGPLDFLVQGIVDAYPTLQACFEQLDAGSRQDLFSDLPFLFFLDSVDELSDTTAINAVNQLYNPAQWSKSVFVITCRSEVLDSAVISSALPPPRQFLPHGPVQPALMTSLYLLPFSAAQRDTYVTIFAEKYTDLNQRWTAGQYTHALK